MILSPISTFLIVEDSPHQARIMSEMLSRLGYKNVSAVEDGFVALEVLKTTRFDVVISDWNMPRVSGYDLLLVIRANPKHAGVVFLMVTENISLEAEAKARRAFASGYLRKPYDPSSLRIALKIAADNVQSAREPPTRR